MASWADVGLALAGAPVGAALAVVGVHLTNRSNLRAQAAQLDAERKKDSEAARLAKRDETYRELIERTNRLYASFKPVQDYTLPDLGLIASLLELEAPLVLYAPAHINDAMIAFADRANEFNVVLHHGYPFAYNHRGSRDVGEIGEEEAYGMAKGAYEWLIDVVRVDLGLDEAFRHC